MIQIYPVVAKLHLPWIDMLFIHQVMLHCFAIDNNSIYPPVCAAQDGAIPTRNKAAVASLAGKYNGNSGESGNRHAESDQRKVIGVCNLYPMLPEIGAELKGGAPGVGL